MVKFVRTNHGIAPFALCLLEIEMTNLRTA